MKTLLILTALLLLAGCATTQYPFETEHEWTFEGDHWRLVQDVEEVDK